MKKKIEEINRETCKKVDKNRETEGRIKNRRTERKKETVKHPRKDKDKRIRADEMRLECIKINS